MLYARENVRLLILCLNTKLYEVRNDKTSMFDGHFWPDHECFLSSILSKCLLLISTGARENFYLLVNDKIMILFSVGCST